MKLCGLECVPMCDFCRYMSPYSEDKCEETVCFGICNKHQNEIEFLHDYCDDFECIRTISKG